MSVYRPLTIGLLLVSLAGCANTLEPDALFVPLDMLEADAAPLPAADAAQAEAAALQIMSNVITAELLVGGQVGSRLLNAGEAASATAPAEVAVVTDGDPAAVEPVTVPVRAVVGQREALERALLLERWVETRFESIALTRDDVRRGQRMLADLGFDPGPIDGVAGPRTRAAIENFQAAQNIAVTGGMTRSLLDLLAILQG